MDYDGINEIVIAHGGDPVIPAEVNYSHLNSTRNKYKLFKYKLYYPYISLIPLLVLHIVWLLHSIKVQSISTKMLQK